MSKSPTKRNSSILPGSDLKHRSNTAATPAPIQTPSRQRPRTGRFVEAARVSPIVDVRTTASPRPSKQSMIATMLRQKGGAPLADLMTATGWQSHSVRAALTGLRKAGHQIERQRDAAGATRYRLVAATRHGRSTLRTGAACSIASRPASG